MINLDTLSSKEIRRLNGRIFYHDHNLYCQIKELLLELQNVVSILEEVGDEVIRAYLLTKKGAVINDLLCKNSEWNYPDYPEMEE